MSNKDNERLRKTTIAFLKDFAEQGYENAVECIDWLEKQGEQQDKVRWTEHDRIMAFTLMRDVDQISFISKEGKNERIGWLNNLDEKFIHQPKQEWSEEDEDNFKHLLDEIVCLGNNRNSANRLYYDRLIKFIEELKNRAQPKEKWCDKDERMLDRLIAYFEKQVALTDDDNPRYANWLTSLKERINA